METVDFSNIFKQYIKNNTSNMEVTKLGFVNTIKSFCNNFVLYMFSNFKNVYNDTTDKKLKNNIDKLYNYIK